jgi:hypothetical protein
MIVAGGASIATGLARCLPSFDAVSPGGHLLTTAAACAITAYATGSIPITAAVAAGGFFIDIDHAADYLLFDRQRDLHPRAFLDYYVAGRMRYAVLVLHSYELFAVLLAIAWWTKSSLLSGYLIGGLLHLGLDIVFNGRITPYSITAFYSFGYRFAHRFDAVALLGMVDRPQGAGFWRMFFEGAPPLAPLSSAARSPGSTVSEGLT